MTTVDEAFKQNRKYYIYLNNGGGCLPALDSEVLFSDTTVSFVGAITIGDNGEELVEDTLVVIPLSSILYIEAHLVENVTPQSKRLI